MLERLRSRVIGSVLGWDLIATLLCLMLIIGVDLETTLRRWSLYAGVVVIWSLVFIVLAPQQAVFDRTILEAFTRLLLAVLLAATSFAGLLYLINGNLFERDSFLRFVMLDLVIVSVIHLSFRTLAHWRRAHRGRRVLVVGQANAAARLAEEFSRRPWTGVQIVGYASDEWDGPNTLPRLGDLSDLITLVQRHQIDEVIFALPPAQYGRVAELSLLLLREPVMLHMIPTALDLVFARTPVDNIGGIPLVSLRESALTPSQRIVKRLFDIVVSCGLIVLLAPLMLVIALLIKLESPGPVIFAQERIGEHGRRFKMFKFRSMYIDADRRWREVAKRDTTTGKLIHKQQDDPRVTRVGRKLRRTSLDELPQLFNVLRGEMSLVGPRPEMPYIAAEYEPWQWQRFRVPPGMTGWWQVNGRSEKPMHLHTEDDLYYIQNYSFWLDLRILAKTLVVVWQGHGAY